MQKKQRKPRKRDEVQSHKARLTKLAETVHQDVHSPGRSPASVPASEIRTVRAGVLTRRIAFKTLPAR